MNENDSFVVLSAQLVEMQTQLAFQEDMIQSLNQTVLQQQREMAQLSEQLEQMKVLLKESFAKPDKLPVNERPPHY